MSNIRALLQNVQQLLSDMWVLAGELEGESWEDLLKVIAVLEVS